MRNSNFRQSKTALKCTNKQNLQQVNMQCNFKICYNKINSVDIANCNKKSYFFKCSDEVIIISLLKLWQFN